MRTYGSLNRYVCRYSTRGKGEGEENATNVIEIEKFRANTRYMWNNIA